MYADGQQISKTNFFNNDLSRATRVSLGGWSFDHLHLRYYFTRVFGVYLFCFFLSEKFAQFFCFKKALHSITQIFWLVLYPSTYRFIVTGHQVTSGLLHTLFTFFWGCIVWYFKHYGANRCRTTYHNSPERPPSKLTSSSVFLFHPYPNPVSLQRLAELSRMLAVKDVRDPNYVQVK